MNFILFLWTLLSLPKCSMCLPAPICRPPVVVEWPGVSGRCPVQLSNRNRAPPSASSQTSGLKKYSLEFPWFPSDWLADSFCVVQRTHVLLSRLCCHPPTIEYGGLEGHKKGHKKWCKKKDRRGTIRCKTEAKLPFDFDFFIHLTSLLLGIRPQPSTSIKAKALLSWMCVRNHQT